MPKHIWPKWLRYSVATVAIVVGLLPLIFAPWLAESLGWDRATGSNIGALITMAYCALGGVISIRIIRQQARRELGEEVNRLLYPYRDEEDKGEAVNRCLSGRRAAMAGRSEGGG